MESVILQPVCAYKVAALDMIIAMTLSQFDEVQP